MINKKDNDFIHGIIKISHLGYPNYIEIIYTTAYILYLIKTDKEFNFAKN